MNELRLEDWDAISGLPANRTLTVPSRFTEVAAGMTLLRTVVEESATLSRVTFTVTWDGITGRAHTTSEEAVFTKNGLSASYGY